MSEENKLEPVKKEDLIKDYPKEVKKKKKEYYHEIKSLWNEKNYPGVALKAREASAELPAKPTGVGDEDISGIYLLHASALWELNHDKNEALPLAILAAQFDRSNKDAMWLIREINGHQSGSSKLFRLDVRGEYYIPVGDGVQLNPFMTSYDVVADNEEEALNFIKQYERHELAERIKLKEAIVKKELCKDLKGVYNVSALFSYNLEEGE